MSSDSCFDKSLTRIALSPRRNDTNPEYCRLLSIGMLFKVDPASDEIFISRLSDTASPIPTRDVTSENTGSLSAYYVGTKGTHLLWVNQINQNIQSAALAEFAPGIHINQFRPYKAIRALAWYRRQAHRELCSWGCVWRSGTALVRSAATSFAPRALLLALDLLFKFGACYLSLHGCASHINRNDVARNAARLRGIYASFDSIASRCRLGGLISLGGNSGWSSSIAK